MPRKLAFPIMRAPQAWGGNECAIFYCEPIKHAIVGMSPGQCYVVGTDLVRGTPIKWNCPIGDFQEAARNAVTFVEVDDMRAPTVTLDRKNLPILHR